MAVGKPPETALFPITYPALQQRRATLNHGTRMFVKVYDASVYGSSSVLKCRIFLNRKELDRETRRYSNRED
jgi:hypothetical protein